MIIPDHYCANLHAALKLNLTPDGKIIATQCAVEPTKVLITDNKVFDHPKLVQIRDSNIKNQKLEGTCAQCQQLECDGVQGNIRGAVNHRYINDKLLYNQTGPKQITFQVSYACNLACVICFPEYSSFWRKEVGINNTAISINEDLLRSTIRNINFENLETLHIYGGEPFLGNTHNIILEELKPYGKNITVWYDTNGTILPSEKTMELWEAFHLIRIKFSIDGINEAFNYLRWPADWHKVEENIFKMYEILPVNHMFSLRPSIGFLNFHLVNDIIDWQTKNLPTNRLGDLTEFEYNIVFDQYRAEAMTPQMKEDLIDIYGINHPINKVMPRVVTGTPENLAAIKQSLTNLDKKRGLDYRKALPHLNKYLAHI